MFLPSNITLKFGDSGDFVNELQRRLAAVHCFNGDAVNGFFDGATVNAVSQFQSMSGIRADGIAGPETLRRLNGVISGDSSTTADHAAEEERKAQELASRQLEQQLMMAQQQQAPIIEPAVQAPVNEWQREAHQHQPSQALPEVNYAQASSYQPQQPMHQQPQAMAQQAPSDILSQMLMAAPQQAPAAAPEHAHHAAPTANATATAHPVMQHAPAHQTPAAPVTVIPVQVIAQQAPAAVVPPQAAQNTALQAAPQAAAEPRGIIGRAVQYANDMVQKLSAYFESKLPNHVIAEVKEIGQIMAKSGVREASIPMGPEQQQQRGVETPGRSAQQGVQRS